MTIQSCKRSFIRSRTTRNHDIAYRRPWMFSSYSTIVIVRICLPEDNTYDGHWRINVAAGQKKYNGRYQALSGWGFATNAILNLTSTTLSECHVQELNWTSEKELEQLVRAFYCSCSNLSKSLGSNPCDSFTASSNFLTPIGIFDDRAITEYPFNKKVLMHFAYS